MMRIHRGDKYPDSFSVPGSFHYAANVLFELDADLRSVTLNSAPDYILIVSTPGYSIPEIIRKEFEARVVPAGMLCRYSDEI